VFLGFSLLSFFELMIKGSIHLCRLGKRLKSKLCEQIRKISNSHAQQTNSIDIQSDPVDIDFCENHDSLTMSSRPNSSLMVVENV